MRKQEYKVFDGQIWHEPVSYNWQTQRLERDGVPIAIAVVDARLYSGFRDSTGRRIYEGDAVRFYYKGQTVQATVIFHEAAGMFCLRWSDGYINQHPLNPEKYTLINA